MIKILKIIAIVALVALIVIQFIPTSRNQSNVVPVTDFISRYNPPNQIATTLRTSCYDCHSNNTKYPWYNKVQPVAWYLEGHIKQGKEELNFNEFGDYSDRRKNSKLKSIISQVEKDKMPLDSYTLIHRNAKISKDEKKLITAWVSQLKDSLKVE